MLFCCVNDCRAGCYVYCNRGGVLEVFFVLRRIQLSIPCSVNTACVLALGTPFKVEDVLEKKKRDAASLYKCNKSI
jgi:hypothetical protein